MKIRIHAFLLSTLALAALACAVGATAPQSAPTTGGNPAAAPAEPTLDPRVEAWADELVGRLADADVDVARSAHAALRALGDKGRPALKRASEGGNANVANEARRLLEAPRGPRPPFAGDRRPPFGPRDGQGALDQRGERGGQRDGARTPDARGPLDGARPLDGTAPRGPRDPGEFGRGPRGGDGALPRRPNGPRAGLPGMRDRAGLPQGGPRPMPQGRHDGPRGPRDDGPRGPRADDAAPAPRDGR